MNPFRYFKTSPEIIRLAVMMYVRFPPPLRKATKRYGRPEQVVTDKLSSYKSAFRDLGNTSRQETGRWRNNRTENSHRPLRRRERIMTRFRSMRSLQKFAAVQPSICNHFNLGRHFYSRPDFKKSRATTLTDGRQLAT